MVRNAVGTAACVVVFAALSSPLHSQPNPNLVTFFRQNIGLGEDQIAAIGSGQPAAKALPPRRPSEVLLFGAVYIHAAPETYFQFARNFDRLRK